MRRLFQSTSGIILTVLLLLMVEYYGFIAVRTATRNLRNMVRNIITVIYVLLTVTFWVILSNIRNLIDQPDYPLLNKYLMAVMLGFFFAKLIIMLFLFIGDIYRFFIWIIHRLFPRRAEDETLLPAGVSRSKFLAQSASLLGGLFLSTMVYGTSNKYNYQLKKLKLWFPNLPEKFSGLKVIQISDIHSGSFDSIEDVRRGIKMIMDQNPDLILFTGDIVNDIHSELIPYKEVFAALKAPLGVFAVLGNHDYGDYHQWNSKEEQVQNIEQLKQHFKDMNWELLMNRHVVFDHAGDRIALIGIENWSAKSNFPKYGKMREAVAGLDEKRPEFKILMSHDPSHWDAEVRPEYGDIDLTLSGHTHGMQFGIRLPWMKWSLVQYMYKQWAGLYQEGRQYLYVNPGFGFIGYKGRVGILPEITVFELMKG